jgi:hypothetical protein
MDGFLSGFQGFGETSGIADGGGLEGVEGNAGSGHLGDEKMPHQFLSGVDGPEECGDSLGIAPEEERGVRSDGVGDVGGGSALNVFEELLAHGLLAGKFTVPGGCAEGLKRLQKKAGKLAN